MKKVVTIFFLCFFVHSALAGDTVGRKIEIDKDVVMEVQALHRTKEDTVMVKFNIINKSNSSFSLSPLGASSMTEVKLLHLGSRKLYKCMTVHGRCFGSSWSKDRTVGAGEERLLWSHFTAPPGKIKTVSLVIGDQLPVPDFTIGDAPSK